MKTLHLTLTAEWFDMILRGEKTEEYREFKPYWVKRLIDYSGCPEEMKGDNKTIPENIVYDVKENSFPLNRVLLAYYSKQKHYDVIEFSNGYSKTARKIIVEYRGLKYDTGLMNWGAPELPVFVLMLGRILETKNINQ